MADPVVGVPPIVFEEWTDPERKGVKEKLTEMHLWSEGDVVEVVRNVLDEADNPREMCDHVLAWRAYLCFEYGDEDKGVKLAKEVEDVRRFVTPIFVLLGAPGFVHVICQDGSAPRSEKVEEFLAIEEMWEMMCYPREHFTGDMEQLAWDYMKPRFALLEKERQLQLLQLYVEEHGLDNGALRAWLNKIITGDQLRIELYTTLAHGT